jgi:hypothetical protein
VATRLGARLPYVALAVGTIALGLTIHERGTVFGLGPATRDVLGDALWAAMLFWWLGALAPSVRPATRGLVAVALCVAVELSQLLHGAALDAARRTTAGRLVLGSDFDARDLLAYTAGVLAAVLVESAARRRRRRSDAQRRAGDVRAAGRPDG